MQIHLGYRRIQLIRGTAFISLPKIWVKMRELRKGDGVGIKLREDGVLEISPVKGGNEDDSF